MGYSVKLSKSRYCRGLQCPKMLWLEKFMPEQASPVGNEAVLANGTRVGELAQGYFGAYQAVAYSDDKNAMCAETARLLETDICNICEASFAIDGLYCAVDILHRNGDGWDIVEVKSSTHVSDIYIEDMAFQNYVLTRCGVKVKGVYILHIDNSYVRRGELDLQQLFVLKDYTDVCRDKYAAVERNIALIRSYVDTDAEPDKELDACCFSPYECAFRGYCGRHLPEDSVFDIANMGMQKKCELYHRGIVSFGDVLCSGIKLSANQLQQVAARYHQEPDHVDGKAIGKFLRDIRYPVYHLDFETFQQAIPEYQGCRPYCQLPFQYSLHIQQADGTLEHREYLAKEGEDPRRGLAEQLCRDIPADAFCLAYNMSFEKGRLKELAEVFPDLSDHLLAIAGGMHDLMVPFQKRYFYSRSMGGSFSIKSVLPALFPDDPELNYQSLEGIHKGDEAANAFADLSGRTPEEIAVIRRNLLAYCRLDTYAMVKILDKLRALES